MASYREALLVQEEPLEPHEVADLEGWLRVLREDVAAFGPTAEDEARMEAIERRVAEAKGSPAPAGR